MGGSSSQPQHRPLVMEHPQTPYPDMNQIFQGIPKMMQVADDMHRMTGYIEDLRNMTLALGVMGFIGFLLFLLVKFKSDRRSRSRRRREDPYAPRQIQPLSSDSWERNNHNGTHKMELERMRLSQSGSHHDFANPMTISTSDHSQSNGGPMHKKHEPIKLMVEDLPYADS